MVVAVAAHWRNAMCHAVNSTGHHWSIVGAASASAGSRSNLENAISSVSEKSRSNGFRRDFATQSSDPPSAGSWFSLSLEMTTRKRLLEFAIGVPNGRYGSRPGA